MPEAEEKEAESHLPMAGRIMFLYPLEVHILPQELVTMLGHKAKGIKVADGIKIVIL